MSEESQEYEQRCGLTMLSIKIKRDRVDHRSRLISTLLKRMTTDYNRKQSVCVCVFIGEGARMCVHVCVWTHTHTVVLNTSEAL